MFLRITLTLCLTWIQFQGIRAPPPITPTDPVYLTPCTTVTGNNLGKYEEFLGIPFALPPVGDLRFRDPQPYPMWTGNRAAINNTLYCWQSCPQLSIPSSGNEDCLFLHVYRPRAYRKSTKPLNVIVLFYGGNFYSGRNNPMFYGPQFLMDTEEVILVSPAYRLNVFGFLSTGDSVSPGNYGLKDMVLSLKWVQEHIGAFGGDPDQVTLLGHDSSGASLQYLMMSDVAEGLYKNVVIFSGAATSPSYRPMADPRAYANRHAKIMGIKNPHRLSSQELVDKFRNLTPTELIEGTNKLRSWSDFPVTTYLPTVEPYGTPNAIITDYPEQAMMDGHFHNKSVLMGIVVWDGLNHVQPLLTEEANITAFNENIYELLPLILYMDPTNPRIREVVDKIRFKYFGPTGLMGSNEAYGGIMQMASDYFFIRPAVQTATLMSNKTDQKPFYLMQWQYQGDDGLASIYTGNEDFAFKLAHGEDLLLLISLNLLYPKGFPKDQKAQNAMIDNVMNFVKYDCPNMDPWQGSDPKLNVFRNDRKTQFARDLVGTKALREDLAFWDFVERILEEGRKECPPKP